MSGSPTGRGVNSNLALDPTEMLSLPPYSASLTVPNRPESVRPAVLFLVETARALGVAEASTPLFEVAITEAVTNAVKHGHSGHGDDAIVCEVERLPGQLIFRILDNGPGFAMPDPTLPNIAADAVHTVPESGYGLPIIQSVFPAVRGIRVNGRFGLELCLPIA
jgi:serine/threonine-protein kinase RsbW